MATAEEYEVVGMGGCCFRGASASCVRVAPKPSGPSRPCPAREPEGQWNSLCSGPGDVAVGRDSLGISTSIIDTMFRLASRLRQVLYNKTRLKLNANS